MIFTREQAVLVRQGKITAAIVPASERVTPGRLRRLRRRYVRHDQDGNPAGEAVETVTDGGLPVLLTVLAVEDRWLHEIAYQDARVCGYQTASALRDAWKARHPRIERVRLVRFQLGDARDRDRYLNWTGRAGGDYTQNRHRAADEMAALTPEQLAPITAQARVRDQARRKSELREAAHLPLATRLERLDRLRHQRRVDVTREMRIIEERLRRAENLLQEESVRPPDTLAVATQPLADTGGGRRA